MKFSSSGLALSLVGLLDLCQSNREDFRSERGDEFAQDTKHTRFTTMSEGGMQTLPWMQLTCGGSAFPVRAGGWKFLVVFGFCKPKVTRMETRRNIRMEFLIGTLLLVYSGDHF
jgi:hypothetical protein